MHRTDLARLSRNFDGVLPPAPNNLRADYIHKLGPDKPGSIGPALEEAITGDEGQIAGHLVLRCLYGARV